MSAGLLRHSGLSLPRLTALVGQLHSEAWPHPRPVDLGRLDSSPPPARVSHSRNRILKEDHHYHPPFQPRKKTRFRQVPIPELLV